MDVNGKPRIKKQVKKNIRIEPNVGAAIFLLTNIAPERWKNKRDFGIDEKDVKLNEINEPIKVIFEDYTKSDEV